MISVHDALTACLGLIKPLGIEEVPLISASGRVLARDVTAQRDQPPFAASAMDGYALRTEEAHPGARFKVIGEAAAGHGWPGALAPGQACRIFTGAPIPKAATRVIIQEDVTREGDIITLRDSLDPASYIRPAGGDFHRGTSIPAPRKLRPTDIALAAAMNLPTLPVTRKPVLALIATGDELVQPGDTPRDDQIIASNSYGLKALFEAEGAEARLLPIARDCEESLNLAFDLAQTADLIVTIGGASVGDHDLVAETAQKRGLERAFYKIAMRPGKPLMAGKIGASALIGLPGNPVSSMICGMIFVLPMIRAFLGQSHSPLPLSSAILTKDLPSNGAREHYMRAVLTGEEIHALERQDSSLLSVLNNANALLVRPPFDNARKAGDRVPFIPL